MPYPFLLRAPTRKEVCRALTDRLTKYLTASPDFPNAQRAHLKLILQPTRVIGNAGLVTPFAGSC
jgi:hypothetical protein